jgi:anhydro-N-acetylmuramic acid kinase
MSRLVVGCMTGTSIDAIDASLVAIEGGGLEMQARFIRGVSRDLDPIRAELRHLASQQPMAAGETANLAHRFALLHLDAIRQLVAKETPDLICVHGQTVFHQPPVSWQLMHPAPIAHALRCPVVFDLRSADLAAGGQGAPVTPLSDYVMYSAPEPVDIVNLGGFCNITHLPARGDAIETIRGRDVCACNQLLDAVSRATTDHPYDRDGACAARGDPDRRDLERLTTLLTRQAISGRSLGTGDELFGWIESVRHTIPPETIAATACEALGGVIGRQLHAPKAILAGGGVRNRTLVAAIRRHTSGEVHLSDDFGIPCEYREAAAFAVLGALCQDRVPITLPQVTGVPSPAPIAGSWVLP